MKPSETEIEFWESIKDLHVAFRDHNFLFIRLSISQTQQYLTNISDVDSHKMAQFTLGSSMIDIGSSIDDDKILEEGTRLVEEALSSFTEDELEVRHHYNLANGFLAIWQKKAKDCCAQGVIDPSYPQGKKHYRIAYRLAKEGGKKLDKKLFSNLLVNYGNCLDSIGRTAEALAYYDEALIISPDMGEALGNRAFALIRSAYYIQEYRCQFLSEANNLLSKALRSDLPKHMRDPFSKWAKITSKHRSDCPRLNRETEKTTLSPFENFYEKFCAKNRLYLTSTTFLSQTNLHVYGDPMYVSHFVVNINKEDRVDRYLTFLNSIKEDYALARYFLAQSLFPSETIDLIEKDLSLYYPLDYSLYGPYLQLQKTALKMAIDILDKIAFFIRDYCHVQSIKNNQVDFRKIWTTPHSTLSLRPELAKFKNLLMLALFDISLEFRDDEDTNKRGYYYYYYRDRQAITHRFLSVHEFIPDKDILEASNRKGGIQRVSRDALKKESIAAMAFACEAIICLIGFVDSVEKGKKSKGTMSMPISSTPVEEYCQWSPRPRSPSSA